MKKDTEVKQAVANTETAAKKPAARKPAAPRKRAAAKASEEVYVQFGAGEWNAAALVEQAKADYAAQGHDVASIKKVAVYVKPQEGKAYYVVNDTDTGSVAL